MYEVLDKVKIVAEDEIRYGCITNIKDDTYTVYVETEKKFYDIPGRMILEKTAPVSKKNVLVAKTRNIYLYKKIC